MNAARNTDYAGSAPDGGALSLPVPFLHAAYDGVCRTVNSRLADPMRKSCTKLTETVIASGHWMAQEQPVAVNRAIAKFIFGELPELGR
jgi:pimeloyl-ACP methyl ester carboxylesterase